MKKWQNRLNDFWNEEDGIGTLEMMLLIAVIIIVAVAFRKWIMKWVYSLFTSTDSQISNTNMSGNADQISPAAGQS